MRLCMKIKYVRVLAFFVLAGARVKYIDEGGSVYIHRPFINNDNEFDPERQKVRYKKIESQIKKYLN